MQTFWSIAYPPATGVTAPLGQSRRTGHVGLASHAASSIVIVDMRIDSVQVPTLQCARRLCWSRIAHHTPWGIRTASVHAETPTVTMANSPHPDSEVRAREAKDRCDQS